MSARCDYTIDGKTYCQVELGSARAALAMPYLLDSMSAGGDHRRILSGILRHAHQLMPIVLLDDGMTERQWVQANQDPRWLEERGLYFSTLCAYTQALEVLQDFLACNPIGLWLDKAAGVLEMFTQIISTPSGNSNGSAPSAPAVIQPGATPSSL